MDTLKSIMRHATAWEKAKMALGLSILVPGAIATAVLVQESTFVGLAVAICLLVGLCVLQYGKWTYINRMGWVFSHNRLRFSLDAEKEIFKTNRHFVNEEELGTFLQEFSETKQVQLNQLEMDMIRSKLWSAMVVGTQLSQQA